MESNTAAPVDYSGRFVERPTGLTEWQESVSARGEDQFVVGAAVDFGLQHPRDEVGHRDRPAAVILRRPLDETGLGHVGHRAADPNAPRVKIDVGHPQRGGFTEPQSAVTEYQ